MTSTHTRGVVHILSAPTALCPHVEWALSSVLGPATSVEWEGQPVAPGLSAQIGQVAQLAISLEAPGHAPAPNKPDGPVVASGDIQTL